MAVNAYLVVDGRPGGSKSKTNAIDILSFSFGASMHVTIGVGDAQTQAGKANLSEVSIMKAVDKVTPAFFDDCVTGNILKSVDIIYDKADGSAQVDYYKIHMEDVLISSIQNSGSSENPTESISFAFHKIKLGYAAEKEDGGGVDGFVEKGYDVEILKPW